MQALIIVPPGLKPALEDVINEPHTALWASELPEGFAHLEASDIDVVIYDGRNNQGANALAELIGHMPVTTRLLAMVDQLPGQEIFSESGIVYLTPPINLEDVSWFLKSHDACCIDW